MDIRKLFGANTRRFRLDLRLSQEAVAERMGVDRAFISSMERGLQNVTLLTIWQVSQALEVRPAQLLEEKTAKNSSIILLGRPYLRSESRKGRLGPPRASQAQGCADLGCCGGRQFASPVMHRRSIMDGEN
ncbi:helix-turn-helix domain-containing protein [Bradyrhizobium sp. LM6.9]